MLGNGLRSFSIVYSAICVVGANFIYINSLTSDEPTRF